MNSTLADRQSRPANLGLTRDFAVVVVYMVPEEGLEPA